MLCNASTLLKDILTEAPPRNDENEDNVIDLHMPDFTPPQIHAFVNLCELLGSDGCTHLEEGPLTLAEFLTSKPSHELHNLIKDALPMIHKYDARALQHLCKTHISKFPNIVTVRAYETYYDHESEWPNHIISFLVNETLPNRPKGPTGRRGGRTDVESLHDLTKGTLVRMLRCIREYDPMI
jgi:hypothetical protein